MSEKNELTYENAYAELQEILHNIEQDNVSVDDLATLLARSKELLTFCQHKLKNTKDVISDLMEENEDD